MMRDTTVDADADADVVEVDPGEARHLARRRRLPG